MHCNGYPRKYYLCEIQTILTVRNKCLTKTTFERVNKLFIKYSVFNFVVVTLQMKNRLIHIFGIF